MLLVLGAYLSLCLLPVVVSGEHLFPFVEAVTGRLGVFPFIGLFLLALFSLAALSSMLFDAWRIPALTLIVLLAIALAATDVNSDSNARLLGSSETDMQPPRIATAFRQWLAARKDYAPPVAGTASRPYPVYLIAMAGGGAYAGFHSSYFLSRLFESCPALRHHTFAISGVSGGALGAALIAAEAGGKPGAAVPPAAGSTQRCSIDTDVGAEGGPSRNVERFFSLDHVSVLIWARFYPDMLRRLLWFQAPRLASDTLFEEWLTSAWSRIAADPQALSLSDSVYSYWRPDGDVPALFLNITNTATGRAEVVSPLHYPRNLPSRINADMRIITAAGLSFRFPILTSPGTLPRKTSIPAQGFDPVTDFDDLETPASYVDGGYYENSGLHVLNRVRSELEAAAAKLNIEVRLISFSASPNRQGSAQSDGEQGTLLAPINALLAARTQRGVDEWEAALRQHGKFDAHMTLYQDEWHHRLPLGWTLSHQSVTFIKRHFGVPLDCDYTERFWERLLDDFDGARAYLAQRFPPDDYGIGMPGIRPRDLDVKDTDRIVKLDMLSERIYMGCQVGKIFRDLASWQARPPAPAP
jgi:hypothetical protein